MMKHKIKQKHVIANAPQKIEWVCTLTDKETEKNTFKVFRKLVDNTK